MERDLKIVQRLDDNPIIWKVLPHFLPLFLNLRISTSICPLQVLWGLAEVRPALCYCSVILRGALAVQMAYWSSALTTSPKTLEATKRILSLMSVGQYLPPPLDSVSEVIHVFHPYQVRGSQCGNLRIFLSFRFYVKSILENLEVLKMPFCHLRGFEVKKLVEFKIQSLSNC